MLTLVPELPDMKSMEKLLPLGRIVWLPMTPEKEEPFHLVIASPITSASMSVE